MNQRLDQPIVNLRDLRHRRRRQCRQLRGGDVVPQLFRGPGTGDHAADLVKHQNPSQRKLRHRRPAGHERSQFFDGREGHIDPGRERADVVPGSRARTTCAGSILRLIDRQAAEFRLSVAHDEPYRGGFSTTHYGRPKERVHAIQIELARRLYMDEQALTKKPREFEGLRTFCRTFTQSLGELSLP